MACFPACTPLPTPHSGLHWLQASIPVASRVVTEITSPDKRRGMVGGKVLILKATRRRRSPRAWSFRSDNFVTWAHKHTVFWLACSAYRNEYLKIWSALLSPFQRLLQKCPHVSMTNGLTPLVFTYFEATSAIFRRTALKLLQCSAITSSRDTWQDVAVSSPWDGWHKATSHVQMEWFCVCSSTVPGCTAPGHVKVHVSSQTLKFWARGVEGDLSRSKQACQLVLLRSCLGTI